MKTQTAPAPAKIGDVISRNKDIIKTEISKLEAGASFVNKFLEEFKDLKMKGTILQFINACASREGYYQYIEQAGEIAEEDCRREKMSISALVKVAKDEHVKRTTDFVNIVRSEISIDQYIMSAISELEIVDDKAQVKQQSISRIENQHTVKLTNDEQVDFWNNFLDAKHILDYIDSMIAKHKPEGSAWDMSSVIVLAPSWQGGGLVCTKPEFIKLISPQ